jgi:hypothetical protein
VPLDSHRPDAVELAPYHAPDAFVDDDTGREGSARPSPCAASARRFPPASRWSPAARSSFARGSPRDRHQRGPWRVSGEGGPSAPVHDEWDVELGEGVICRLTQRRVRLGLDGIYAGSHVRRAARPSAFSFLAEATPAGGPGEWRSRAAARRSSTPTALRRAPALPRARARPQPSSAPR